MSTYMGGTFTKAGMWGDLPRGEYDGFVPGEIMSLVAPNARSQIMVDTPLGKADGMLMGLLFNMRKRGFSVQKVYERMEISPVHPQYYQITIQQKQQLENQIKTSLAGVQTAISDFELLSHDLRRYKEYLDYFQNIEQAKKDKDDDKLKENERVLRSIFIDQVDVHTGEGIALKQIVPRWPTIIVDFMKLRDTDLDPKKIAEEYGFSEVEGLVLSVKNKLYQKWKEYFLTTVKSRFQHLNELVAARKRSIKEYREMVKPYMARYKQIREFGETEEGRKELFAYSWWRPSTQAVSVDMTEYWMWKPFWPAEIHRPPMISEENKMDIRKFPFDNITRDYIRANWNLIENAKNIPGYEDKNFKEITTSVTGIEPLDKWVIYLQNKMVEHYKKTENYGATLNVLDILQARQDLMDMYDKNNMERWNWLKSPYFVTIELGVFRIVFRSPDGTEGETLIFGDYPKRSLCAKLDSQNTLLLRLLEIKLQEKEYLRWVGDMIGESVEGRTIKEILQETHPLIFQDFTKTVKGKDFVIPNLKKQYSTFRNKIRFLRPGPYDSVFMERIAAISIKDITQTVYAETRKFIKSAAGA